MKYTYLIIRPDQDFSIFDIFYCTDDLDLLYKWLKERKAESSCHLPKTITKKFLIKEFNSELNKFQDTKHSLISVSILYSHQCIDNYRMYVEVYRLKNEVNYEIKKR